MDIRDKLCVVKSKIVAAATKSQQIARDITLVAVSKTFPPEVVQEAVEAGQMVFGENRVQELLSKVPVLPPQLQWHLIGHLQSNKVRKVLPLVVAIHSVDTVALAGQIDRIAGELELEARVYLEVNVSGEGSKFGFEPQLLEAEMENLLKFRRIKIEGLMTVPPYSENPEDSRRYFAALRELRDRLEALGGVRLPGLSMGMSGDYEVAIEEGATIVRVGSAIFGQR